MLRKISLFDPIARKGREQMNPCYLKLLTEYELNESIPKVNSSLTRISFTDIAYEIGS